MNIDPALLRKLNSGQLTITSIEFEINQVDGANT